MTRQPLTPRFKGTDMPNNEEIAFQLDQQWFEYICCGHKDAAEFLSMFFVVCHLWDDLIDKDKPRSDDHINHAFWIAFIDIPRNRYYKQFQSEIQPLMAVSIQEWFTANKLEAGNRRDIAYTLRCSIVSLIHQAAEICGGYEWALKVGEEIRLKTQSHTIQEYVEELDA
jgi:hypothetical protein